jgi:hypothetical protein
MKCDYCKESGELSKMSINEKRFLFCVECREGFLDSYWNFDQLWFVENAPGRQEDWTREDAT